MSAEGILPWERNKNNILLLHNQVGQTKQSTYVLPPINHVYGKCPKKDPEGAKEDEAPPKDFVQLNRGCLKERFLSAKKNQRDYLKKEIKRYRSEHPDVLKKIKKGKVGIDLYLPSEEFTFGIRNRPSTPIQKIVQLSYLQEKEKEILEQYAIIKNEHNKEKKLAVRMNQAAYLRSVTQQKRSSKEQQIIDGINQFKLERFKNIQPKVSSQQKLAPLTHRVHTQENQLDVETNQSPKKQ